MAVFRDPSQASFWEDDREPLEERDSALRYLDEFQPTLPPQFPEIAAWEAMEKARGRKTTRPWGVPLRAWGSFRRQQDRKGKANLGQLVKRRSARPWWIAPEDWTAKDEIQIERENGRWWEPPREQKPEREIAKVSVQEIVIFAAATASAATKALIEGGRFPGVRWVPGVGGVRTITRRTIGC